jgi:UDPglucose 6-dehydrogenase
VRVAVLGAGYVGQVTGVGFAEYGHDVTCVDIDPDKVEQLQRGVPTIEERDLGDLLVRNLRERRINFTTETGRAVVRADAIFIAVPTPSLADGSANLEYVLHAADDIGDGLNETDGGYRVVANKSTVPFGTTSLVKERLLQSTDADLDVVSCPEFLREGNAVEDFLRPDRIVIGTDSERAAELMSKLFDPFVVNGHPIFIMDPLSAEISKYAANAFLAAKISFVNAIAQLCELVGGDVLEVARVMGSDQRIGNQFLRASHGWGGSCFPKDTRALVQMANKAGMELEIVEAAINENERRKTFLPGVVFDRFGRDLSDRRFAMWGLAFKAGTDDVRESPALDAIEVLTEAGAEIVAFDPEATGNAKKILGGNTSVSYADDPYGAMEGADALLIATEWREFRTIDTDRARELLVRPLIIDGRIMFTGQREADLLDAGFEYIRPGRRT